MLPSISGTPGAVIGVQAIAIFDVLRLDADLATYSGNLIAWIKTNNPIATVDAILGARTIIALAGPERNTSLPYEVEGDVPTEYTAADGIPDSYKATLQVFTFGIDVTFYSSDISTQRLTIFPSGSGYALSLNGTVVGTSSTSDDSVRLTITHPYSSTFANQENLFALFPGQDQFLIAQAWGPTRRSLINLHRTALDENVFAGGSPTSEPIMGENLAVLWSTYTAEFARTEGSNHVLQVLTLFTKDLLRSDRKLYGCSVTRNHQLGQLALIPVCRRLHPKCQSHS